MSPTDASLPGTQPMLNPTILLPALRASLALGCTPARVSRFDRKHYFYWDQPAGYQLTQFYEPLATDGRLDLTLEADGVDLAVGIRQVQIEQDTGKTLAAPPNALVDLNRVGTPLIEVITDPFTLHEPETAAKVLARIQGMLRAVDACVLGMEWGGMRADVNVSVRRTGAPELGQRCEIKNLSSFKTVTDAIMSEATRQIEVLTAGGQIAGETRGWDAEYSTTRRLRGKEGEVDYRFMPEPDLPPIVLSEDLLKRVLKTMPLLPEEIIQRLMEKYGLKSKDARILLAWDEGRITRPDSCVAYFINSVKRANFLVNAGGIELRADAVGKVVGNMVVHELGGLLATRNISWAENPVSDERLGQLVALVITDKITGQTAKTLLPRLLTSPDMPEDIVQRENLGVSDSADDEMRAVLAVEIYPWRWPVSEVLDVDVVVWEEPSTIELKDFDG